jgi:hypothetical protein
MNSPYAYVLWTQGDPEPAVFTWPNCVKKYIRDTYTTDGELHLPPDGHLSLFRFKVNPKAGSRVLGATLDVEKFLAS